MCLVIYVHYIFAMTLNNGRHSVGVPAVPERMEAETRCQGRGPSGRGPLDDEWPPCEAGPPGHQKKRAGHNVQHPLPTNRGCHSTG